MTLTGGSATTGLGGNAGFIFNSDGTVDIVEEGSATQHQSATDWIIPNSAASSLYEIRATLDSGNTPDVGTIGSWEALSTNREWSFTDTSNKTCSLTIEIRINGGTVLDSATYNLTIALP